MNTLRIIPLFPDEITRPTERPSFVMAVTEREPARAWLRPVSDDETFATRPSAPTKKNSLLFVCILSLIIGSLGGYLGRAALPYAARILRSAVPGASPRHAEIERPVALVSQAAAKKADVEPDAPPPKKKKVLPAKTPDAALEIETSFRMDS